MKNMVLEIDGSMLEGGGQILRTSIALSVLRSVPIHVTKIRAGRSKGGLAAQHLKGVRLARDLCGAKLTGDSFGSQEITFDPGEIKYGHFSADTETAGSICLLFQVALPCILYSSSETHLTLKGGTNAEMAPQIDYFMEVFKPMLQKFGADFDCDVVKRGFFPVGKGIVKFKVNPVKELKSVDILEFGQVVQIRGMAFVAGSLPMKMAEEMARAAENILQQNLKVEVSIKPIKFGHDEAFGNGSGVNIVAVTSTGCVLGGSSLGRRGLRNHEVGRKAAEELLESLTRKVCVDQHMQDQIILLMVLAQGRSRVRTGPVTLHTETAIHIAQLMTDAKFKVVKLEGDCNVIECEGVGGRRQDL